MKETRERSEERGSKGLKEKLGGEKNWERWVANEREQLSFAPYNAAINSGNNHTESQKITHKHTHMHLHCLPWCLTWATCCDQTAIKRWSRLLCVVLFGSPFISDPPSISQRFSQPESFIVPSPLTIFSYSCYFPHALDRSLTAAASSVTFIFYFFLVVSSVCPQLRHASSLII